MIHKESIISDLDALNGHWDLISVFLFDELLLFCLLNAVFTELCLFPLLFFFCFFPSCLCNLYLPRCTVQERMLFLLWAGNHTKIVQGIEGE